MKNLQLIFASVCVALLSTSAVAAETRSATLAISGMDCASCPITIKQVLKKEPGVSEVSIDLKLRVAMVKFDPDKTQPEKLAKAVSEYGYPTTVKK